MGLRPQQLSDLLGIFFLSLGVKMCRYVPCLTPNITESHIGGRTWRGEVVRASFLPAAFVAEPVTWRRPFVL